MRRGRLLYKQADAWCRKHELLRNIRISRLLRKYIVIAGIFVIGAAVGLAAWAFIKLPFKNPWNVTGPLTLLKFNPANNIVRFVFMAMLPTILLLLLVFLGRDRIRGILFCAPGVPGYRPGGKPRRPVAVLLGLLLVAFVLLAAINFPTAAYSSSANPTPEIDTFHEGESMGPGENYARGEVPYKDFIFVHGPYEDPIRAVVAFKLFGRSVASVRTLQSINKVVAFLLLGFMLFRLFQGDWLLIFLSLILPMVLQIYPKLSPGSLFVNNPIMMQFPEREMTSFAFVIMATYFSDAIRTDRAKGGRLIIIGALFSFFPLASFAYSIDRGFYNIAAWLVLVVLLFFFLFNKKGLRLPFLSSTALGLIGGLVVLGFALRWEFRDFFKFAFLDMPRYKELMDGYIYPIHGIFGLSLILLIAFNIFWVAFRFLRKYELSARRFVVAVRSFLVEYLVELTLLLLAVFSFRSALGRADTAHLQYSCTFTYLLTLYIFLKHYLARWLKAAAARKVLSGLTAIILIVMLSVGVYRLVDRDRITSNFPVLKGYEDSHFVPESYLRAAAFIKENLAPDEYFVTMTNEASWYYFVEKPSPVRFQVMWFAMPEPYQREIVKDLANKKVKLIIYRNNSPCNHIDGIRNEYRLPIVFGYINKHYLPYRTIDGNEIWIRKNESPQSIRESHLRGC